MARHAQVSVEVTADGTTDGFARFCRGESAVNNASVPIPGQGELVDYQQMCEDNGVEFIELPVALGAVTLVANDEIDFVDDLSMAQLEQLWSADSRVQLWSDLNPVWPQEKIGFYGRPEGSGTREFFIDSVLGEGGQIRSDHRATDEIDELSGWIAEDPGGIGFMGVGNYLATDGSIRRDLKNFAVEGVAPTRESSQAGLYPLSRPLFIYVAMEALEEPLVADFAEHYVTHAESLAPRVYFFPLPHEVHEWAEQRLADRVRGTVSAPGTTDHDNGAAPPGFPILGGQAAAS